MKTTFRKMAFVLVAITAKKANAQSSIDFSGIAPQSRVVRRGGVGFGFDLFAEPLNFSGRKKGTSLVMGRSTRASYKPEVRFGGNFSYMNLDRSNVSGVPLTAPLTGLSNVKVNNDMYAFNTGMRISLPYSCKIIPYVDLFAGCTDFSASLDIKPYNKMKSTSTQSVYDFASLSYGGTAGVMIALGKYWKLDLGVMYSTFLNQGQMVDPSTARLEAGSINVDRIATPTDMLTFKAGLTYSFSMLSTGGSSYYSGSHCRGHYSCHSHGGGGHVSIHVR